MNEKNLELVKAHINKHIETARLLDNEELSSLLIRIAGVCRKSIESGGKIIFMGNGGSAADAQHLAAEFTGRYLIERSPLPAIALSTNTSALTAIGNDYSFDEIFSRQVKALGNKGDVIFGFSTSGSSENIIEALEAAGEIGITRVGFTGEKGRGMRDWTEYLLVIPSEETPLIQEMHIMAGHIVCGLIEEIIFG